MATTGVVAGWGTKEVGEWLTRVGLSHFVPIFVEEV